MGYIEPIPEDTRDDNNELVQFEFKNRVVGANIPPEYISSVEKGECRALGDMSTGHCPKSNSAGDIKNSCAVELSCLARLVSWRVDLPES